MSDFVIVKCAFCGTNFVAHPLAELGGRYEVRIEHTKSEPVYLCDKCRKGLVRFGMKVAPVPFPKEDEHAHG